MSHFELFRCDGRVRIGDQALYPDITFSCSSFLEVADTFPTLVLERLLAADWLTVHALGKGDRHYCPIHKAVAV